MRCAGPPARDQQGAGSVLTEPCAEERGLAELGDDEVFDLGRLDQQLRRGRRYICVGEVERDPVVRPDRLHRDAEGLAQARGDRHRPRRVNAPAERCEDADPPVTDLVAKTLDDDRAIGGNGAGRVGLVAQERQQVARSRLLEHEFVLDACERRFVAEGG